MMFHRSIGCILPVAVLAAGLSACTGEKKAPDEHAADSLMAASLKPTKEQQHVIDSVIASAPSVQAVVTAKGGSRYDVADATLAAAVRREAKKTNDCYTNALRDYDPHLAGKVTVLVNFGGAGWDLIRIEDHTWTGPAGGVVETCINFRAKKEWALPTRGVKIGAHLVQLEFRPDSLHASPPEPKTVTKSKQ
jgi:hypothetical protein